VLLGDGTQAHYEVDQSVPFAVATLVIDGDSVLLTRQFRYPVGRWIFDLPGGAGEVGEHPIDVARRELEEELGLVANELRPLHPFFTNPGRSAWPVHIFLSSCVTTAGTADRSDPAEHPSDAHASSGTALTHRQRRDHRPVAHRRTGCGRDFRSPRAARRRSGPVTGPAPGADCRGHRPAYDRWLRVRLSD
jgi:8-oxo-dGTP pyrophosphatase MutT (NUDIX family)